MRQPLAGIHRRDLVRDCVVGLALAASSPAQADADHGWVFASEHVRLCIRSESFLVEGDYWFRSGDGPILLRFPFPLHEPIGPPVLEAAWVLVDEDRVPLAIDQSHDGFWTWRLEPIAPTVRVRIRYRQSMHADRAAYVLCSAAGWERPLDWAELEVLVPEDREANVWPPMTRTGCRFRARFDAWVPDGDLVVELRSPSNAQ